MSHLPDLLRGEFWTWDDIDAAADRIEQLEAELVEVASWWEKSWLEAFLPERWGLPDPATTPILRALIADALINPKDTP